MPPCKVCKERDEKSEERKKKAEKRKEEQQRNPVDTAFKKVRTAKTSLVKMMRQIRTSVEAHRTNEDLQRLAQEILQEVRSELDKTQTTSATSPEIQAPTAEEEA